MQALFSLISLILQDHLQMEREISFFMLSAYLGNFHQVLKCFININELKLNLLLLSPVKQVLNTV